MKSPDDGPSRAVHPRAGSCPRRATFERGGGLSSALRPCALGAGVDVGRLKQSFEAVDVRLQDERIRACFDRRSAEMMPPGIGDDEGARARLRIADDVACAAVG